MNWHGSRHSVEYLTGIITRSTTTYATSRRTGTRHPAEQLTTSRRTTWSSTRLAAHTLKERNRPWVEEQKHALGRKLSRGYGWSHGRPSKKWSGLKEERPTPRNGRITTTPSTRSSTYTTYTHQAQRTTCSMEVLTRQTSRNITLTWQTPTWTARRPSLTTATFTSTCVPTWIRKGSLSLTNSITHRQTRSRAVYGPASRT